MADSSKPSGAPLRPPIPVRLKGRTQIGMADLRAISGKGKPRSIAPPRPMRLPKSESRASRNGVSGSLISGKETDAAIAELTSRSTGGKALTSTPRTKAPEGVRLQKTLLGLQHSIEKPVATRQDSLEDLPAAGFELAPSGAADSPLALATTQLASNPLVLDAGLPQKQGQKPQAPPPLPLEPQLLSPGGMPTMVGPAPSSPQPERFPLGGLAASPIEPQSRKKVWIRMALVSTALLMLGVTAWLLRDFEQKDAKASTNKPVAAERLAETSLLSDVSDKTSTPSIEKRKAGNSNPSAQPATAKQGPNLEKAAEPAPASAPVTVPPHDEASEGVVGGVATTGEQKDDAARPASDGARLAVAPSANMKPAPAPETELGPSTDSKSEPQSISAQEADRGLDGSLRQAPNCDEVLGGVKFQATKDSDRIRATVKRAETALRNGNVKGAHIVFCEAAALGPDDYRASMGMATLLLIRRDAEASAKWARRALELSPTHPRRAKHALADALVRVGQVQEARKLWLEAAPEPNPSGAQLEAYIARTKDRASSALKQYDYHRAERLYRRAIALGPENKSGIWQLAKTLKRLRQHEAAASWEAKVR